ncbi:uncharacterized protein LY79DRAFT_12724 [Colletotrichum navitas]|uniref:Uncharacterized protein n=1 Tax=Colletotrichum navitas TaxID=681940 RepID=A0AAD8QE09_9PEZI|nr:uncharacterized protein LY79DRAFT_12724 [Colletotrichum navitas]KAK1600266.1 hypothetical protein LY79DRAFT_12724 [Colletotrichum navitas]
MPSRSSVRYACTESPRSSSSSSSSSNAGNDKSGSLVLGNHTHQGQASDWFYHIIADWDWPDSHKYQKNSVRGPNSTKPKMRRSGRQRMSTLTRPLSSPNDSDVSETNARLEYLLLDQATGNILLRPSSGSHDQTPGKQFNTELVRTAARLSAASPLLRKESSGDVLLSAPPLTIGSKRSRSHFHNLIFENGYFYLATYSFDSPFKWSRLLALTSCIESIIYLRFMSREPPLPGSASVRIGTSAGRETAIIDPDLLTHIWLGRDPTMPHHLRPNGEIFLPVIGCFEVNRGHCQPKHRFFIFFTSTRSSAFSLFGVDASFPSKQKGSSPSSGIEDHYMAGSSNVNVNVNGSRGRLTARLGLFGSSLTNSHLNYPASNLRTD